MADLIPVNHDHGIAESVSHQYLTFSLAGDVYGFDILRVKEIRGWGKVRELPNTPDYIKGVLDMRGTIVPIVDLRIRFSLSHVEYTPMTVVIVMSIQFEGNEYVIGVVVDAVSDVLDIKRSDIKPAPNFGTRVNMKFIDGMVMSGDDMVVLLDIDKLLNPEELSSLQDISS